MDEKLLHYIWQYQLFHKDALMAKDGTLIEVLHPGMYNRNQGPDFLNGRIRVDQTLWVGSIEIHVKSSDWMLHQHDEDPHYKNVILHVVWQNDKTL